MGKAKKRQTSSKGSLRIICFGLAFWLKWLKFSMPLSSSCTHVMWIISTRYETVSKDTLSLKECTIKEYNVESLKTYITTTLLSQLDIFSKSIPKLIKI